MEFGFKRYFDYVLNLFAYSFVCSLVFGIFSMFVWLTFRFIGSGCSLLEFWSSQLSGVGFAGSVIGFCVGSLLTVAKRIENKMTQRHASKNNGVKHDSRS